MRQENGEKKMIYQISSIQLYMSQRFRKEPQKKRKGKGKISFNIFNQMILTIQYPKVSF